MNTARPIGTARTLAAVAVGGVLCTTAAIWWLAQRPAVTPDAANAFLEAAIAEIAAESSAGRPAAQAAPPPGFEPRSEPSAGPGTGNVPPPGYSITVFHGEMTKVPMAPRDSETGRDVAAEHPWLVAPGAMDDLIRQAAIANRDWTLGWNGSRGCRASSAWRRRRRR